MELLFRHNLLGKQVIYFPSSNGQTNSLFTLHSPRSRPGAHYERIRRGIPMTRLVDEILTDALEQTESWRMRGIKQRR